MALMKYQILLLISLIVSACSDTENVRYKDTSELELPPVIGINETEKGRVEENNEEIKAGLGDIVSLSGSTAHPVIKIKKMFDRSWQIVEQVLNMNEIEITDKNRDKGIFYLKFDPDTQSAKDSGLFDSLTFFLFKDDYDEAAYELKVSWKDTDTEVSASAINQQDNGSFDDELEAPVVDSGAMLIKTLYKTIRDDLPVE